MVVMTAKRIALVSALLVLAGLWLLGCGGSSGGPSGGVGGIVVDATEPTQPVENAYCYIPIPPRGAGGRASSIVSDYTDANGRYELKGLPLNEDLTLTVEAKAQSSLQFVTTELGVRASAPGAAEQEVTVLAPDVESQISGVTIAPETAVLALDQSQQFAVVVTGYAGPLKPTWWTTGGIGTVDTDGLFAATTLGSGTVHVTLGSWDAPASVTVTGRILFSSTRDGDYEIYSMNPDGTGQSRITYSPATDYLPAWSPDMRKIAYTSNLGGDFGIHVMNADGTGDVNLTLGRSGGGSGRADLGRAAGSDYSPSWSPRGSRIAFFTDRDGNAEIYVMNADGTSQRRLTDDPAYDYAPSWSPDGTEIAFSSDRDGNAEIYVMDTEGKNLANLTNYPAGNDTLPCWSPDGSKIAFTSNRDGDDEIYVMDANGANQRDISNNAMGDDSSPSWCRDSQKVIFRSNRDGNPEIYMMEVDGTKQVNLTNNSAIDQDPSWLR